MRDLARDLRQQSRGRSTSNSRAGTYLPPSFADVEMTPTGVAVASVSSFNNKKEKIIEHITPHSQAVGLPFAADIERDHITPDEIIVADDDDDDDDDDHPLEALQSRDEAPLARVYVSERGGGRDQEVALSCPSSTSNLTGNSSTKMILEQATSSEDSGEPSVYHLSTTLPNMDPDVNFPSPKHRAKLNAWYDKRKHSTQTGRNQQQQQQYHYHQQRGVSVGAGGSYRSGGRGRRMASMIMMGHTPSPQKSTTNHSVYSHDRGRGMLFNDRTVASDDDDSYMDSIGSRTFRTFDDKTAGTFDETVASRTYKRDIFGQPDADGDFLKTKIEIPWASIAVMSIQLLVLMIQLAMCGVARLDINPLVGPYPDAFSEWGGKNAYLMLEQNEWWRLLSASFLHVGVLHLLVNAICMFWVISFFEREWGPLRWVIIYVLSGIGCNAAACAGEQDTIGVGSSGALMGLFAAKLAQVLSHTCFAVRKEINDSIRFDQLIGVFFGIATEAMMSSLTYIDGWGHVGGLVTGFFCGLLLFSNPIISCCTRFWWMLLGLVGLGASYAALGYYVLEYVDPTEDIADPCEYFRSLFPEGYNCECAW